MGNYGSNSYRLFCSDLDGTMFPFYGMPDRKCLGHLKDLLKKSQWVRSCYVTGRNLELTLEAIRDYQLPEPDYLITDVGTKIYSRGRGGRWAEDRTLHAFLRNIWPSGTSDALLRSVSAIRGVKKQGEGVQSEFKCSFYLSVSRKGQALEELHHRLDKMKVRYTVILSKGKEDRMLMDILPRGASKRRAVETLRKRLGIRSHDTIFAGDSGNDIDMLTSNINTIVVNNAESQLKHTILRKTRKKSTFPTLYLSKGRYGCCSGNDVCGVLEGALHFRIFSKNKNTGLVIQIHSMHGLVDGKYTDLGRDEDTGGQVVYVVELAKALSRLPGVVQVDLITRRIRDPMYPVYGKYMEYINRKFKIVRINCGGRGYIKKTRLWPYIGEYVENVMEYINTEGMPPDIIHANYADAGLAGVVLSERTDAVLTFTGHSLGIPKMQRLGVDRDTYSDMDRKFNFSRRIAAEQSAIDKADAVIVSTHDELENQYSGYAIDRRKFHVIPPGIDLRIFHPPGAHEPAHTDVLKTISKGLNEVGKPIILAVSRLEKGKNLGALADAFCRSPGLKKAANLVIVTGMRNKQDEGQRAVYEGLKRTVEATRSAGSVSFVRFIDSKEGLGALYRLAAESRGVFVNPALIEPFGLTVLEASACGLPVIATRHGGPGEIIKDNVNGLLIEPTDRKQIEKAIMRVITDRRTWSMLSRNAIDNARSFSWDETARRELALFRELISRRARERMAVVMNSQEAD
ncbi:MAG: HAD-IIB family hydrolase [Candidatus Marsarchaeota archaeon]|jgi:sucrose-6F-phosphate phosphohydrolase|nr:HAD-IIB family hydrolase [Candidatus Marsarchaeota archaeon]